MSGVCLCCAYMVVEENAIYKCVSIYTGNMPTHKCIYAKVCTSSHVHVRPDSAMYNEMKRALNLQYFSWKLQTCKANAQVALSMYGLLLWYGYVWDFRSFAGRKTCSFVLFYGTRFDSALSYSSHATEISSYMMFILMYTQTSCIWACMFNLAGVWGEYLNIVFRRNFKFLTISNYIIIDII